MDRRFKPISWLMDFEEQKLRPFLRLKLEYMLYDALQRTQWLLFNHHASKKAYHQMEKYT